MQRAPVPAWSATVRLPTENASAEDTVDPLSVIDEAANAEVPAPFGSTLAVKVVRPDGPPSPTVPVEVIVPPVSGAEKTICETVAGQARVTK